MTAAEPTPTLAGRMARGSFVSVVGSVLTRIVGAVTVVVLVRHFGVDDFAAFSFGVAFATLFSTISDLGLDTVVVRELAAAPDERDEVFGSALVAKVIAVVAAAVVGGAVALLYEGSLRAAGLVGTVTVFQAIASTWGLVLTADLKLVAPALLRLGGQIAASAVAVIAVLAGAGPIVVLGLQGAVGFVPGFALLVLVQRRSRLSPRVDRRRVVWLFRESIPVASATLAVVTFVRIDQLLLGAIGTAADVASYGVVVRVVDLLNVVAIGVTAVVLPAVSTLGHAEPARIRRLTIRGHRYLGAVSLPVAAVSITIGGPALGAVFGPEYEGSGTVLAVLASAHVFAFVFVLARQVLIGVGRSRELARLAWAAAVVNVVLNLVLIPRHGALGAAIASLVAYAVPMGLALARGDEDHPFALAAGEMWRPTLSATGLVAITHVAATQWSWGVVAVLAVAAAPVLLIVTGAVRRSDVVELRDALRVPAR